MRKRRQKTSRLPPPGEAPPSPPEQTTRHLHSLWTRCALPENRWADALRLFGKHWSLIRASPAARDLTAARNAGEFLLKHVADSLLVLRAFPGLLDGPVLLADVGSGAGLPGLVLAAALPLAHVTLVESNRRKAGFLALAAETLGLARRVEVATRRSRELGHDEQYAHCFGVVTARAVAPADKLLRDCRLLLAPGGSAVFYKTPPAVRAELPLAEREAGKHKLRIEVSEVLELPGGAGARQFVRVRAPRGDLPGP